MDYEHGLEVLLDLHGQRVNRDDGYWWEIKAWMVNKSKAIPHGIRYSLTLHDRHNTRVFGMDNAHAISAPKKGKYKGRIVYDHMHRNPHDKGVPYEFASPYQLIEDFFSKIDEVIAERESRGVAK
ncbi:DUF6516 family protein [Xenorhabdus sp. PB30.3]|uniref:toxin-antitoxin system TumE family protein n=1 Tax=Xenorhabdus sp. PB30.3 TaxID=2788941 RepID=UPI001E4D8385|nr:DUF6516 family protein [Xenorhabdus sp. PB30.3]MCC8378625.1 hypothetical protein [Xenorhabdus sp. PB30.3]